MHFQRIAVFSTFNIKNSESASIGIRKGIRDDGRLCNLSGIPGSVITSRFDLKTALEGEKTPE
jgi:hypothetical protein